MRRTVKLLEGRHITATDKRNILGCIEFLRTEQNHAIWMGKKGSPKRYCLGPNANEPNIYAVLIEENYRDDFGRPRSSQQKVVVEVKGIDPLPFAEWSIAQSELFDDLEDAQ